MSLLTGYRDVTCKRNIQFYLGQYKPGRVPALLLLEMGQPDNVIFGILLVNFHHSKGPEVEYSYGLPSNIEAAKVWPFLPFQALPDGSHSFEETFTYFTLLFDEKTNSGPPSEGGAEIADTQVDDFTTFFAISCSRQIKTEDLITKSDDITRSTVQKAIVVVARRPIFGQIKDKLSIITNAFFLQRDFSNKSIIGTLHENLTAMYKLPVVDDEAHMYVGLCLRRVMHDFRRHVLIILKAILLEQKVLFYGSDVEALCNLQFGFISLIPNLILNLQDCGSPKLDSYRKGLTMADSFKSSDRQSVLRFLGFPLQIFGKGGLFSPYSPLQQMADLESSNTQFYVAGTSNSLLLEQKSSLCDILVNANDHSVEIISADKSLHHALQLTSHDKRWIDSIVSIVSETWNEDDYATPKNMQFEGSEDFIRWQFEDYLTGMVASEKLNTFVKKNENREQALRSIPEELIQQTPAESYGLPWIRLWRETKNYDTFNNFTDDRLFDLFAPKHVCNSTDTLTSLQQRLSKSFQSLMKKEQTPHREKDEAAADGLQKGSEDASKSFPQKNIPVTEEPIRGASWKDYFNRKKKARDLAGDQLSVPSTHTIALDSTPAAISTALISLGLSELPSDEDYENLEYSQEFTSGEDKRQDSGSTDFVNGENEAHFENEETGGNTEQNPWIGER
ncbi:LAQU0S28e00166g1_1 [Lachancea quebecensis]|uniref:LAQU0S28e00166g1_1 n=1 Tax=Lachancea quebecensis TaxID=1654605 RepID=A0A0P1KXW7_9SACH|nr:LAQU0S28e00166g1_1 [Lachancea quebecensis]